MSLARFVDKKIELGKCMKTFDYSHNLEKKEVGIGLGKWTDKG